MEEVAPEHDLEQSSEEFVANAVVCEGNEGELERIGSLMVGFMEPVLPVLLERGLIRKANGVIELTDLARVMAEHFIGVERLTDILSLVRKTDDPLELLTELECGSARVEKEPARTKARR
jgi:helicase